MKRITFLVLTILLFSCNGKTEKKNEKISEKEIYKFLNTLLITIKEENIPVDSNYVSYDKVDVFKIIKNDKSLITEIDSIFSKNDLNFIKVQFKKNEKFELNQKLIANRVVIPRDTIIKFSKTDFWKSYYLEYGHRGFSKVSMPLFSIDKKTAIISLSFICGRTCGGVEIMIYKKVNGKWIFYKSIMNSAS